jgi:hypothetical protein
MTETAAQLCSFLLGVFSRGAATVSAGASVLFEPGYVNARRPTAFDRRPATRPPPLAGHRRPRRRRGGGLRGIRTPRGVGEWQAGTVSQLLARMPA